MIPPSGRVRVTVCPASSNVIVEATGAIASLPTGVPNSSLQESFLTS